MTRIRWIAESDGQAHAHVGPRATRTVCGKPALSERHAWPGKTRCETCTAAVAALVG
jgi:hypothetical protein